MINAEEVLEATRALNGLDDLAAEENDFYYDETNNYRKVRLHAGGLNFKGYGDFVLGGVVLNRNESVDLSALKKEIRLDKSAHEMKFKHVANGNLISVISSRRLKTILEFLNEHEISIHLQRINILYWSLIDIVESVIAECRDEELILYHLHIKDRLYRVLNAEKEKTLAVLNEFSYPDIGYSRISEFYGQIVDLVNPTVIGDDFIGRLLVRLLEIGRGLEEAVFIQNDVKGVLVDDFSHFYRHRALMFPRSMHYFDAEEQVEEHLRATANAYGETKLDNYSFVDSKQNPNIQLADVTVGYFAKLLNFCKERNPSELRDIRKSLNKNQLEILRLTREIIDRSDSRSRAYFHHVIPISDLESWCKFAY